MSSGCGAFAIELPPKRLKEEPPVCSTMDDILYIVMRATGSYSEYSKEISGIFRDFNEACLFAWKKSLKKNLALLRPRPSGSVVEYFWGSDMHYDYSIREWNLLTNKGHDDETNIYHDDVFKLHKFQIPAISDLLENLMKNSTLPEECLAATRKSCTDTES